MQIGRVCGNIVSTIKKDKDYKGHKLLLVQPVGLDMLPLKGSKTLIAVDLVGAGPDEMVIYVDEGNAGRQLLGLDVDGAIRAVIVGIVDELDVVGQKTWRKYAVVDE
jgi:microcompartment protein CcmK/EutM